jgi:Ca2+-transporting ATPase
MVTHGLPGVAMGAEPGERGLSTRGPRAPDEQILGDGLWRRIAWTGGLIATVALAMGWWAHETNRPWQAMTFGVLGLAQLGVALALRTPAADRARRPHFLDLAVAGAAVLQVAAVTVAPVRELLGLTALGAAELAVVVAAAAVPGLAVLAVQRATRSSSLRRDS